MHPNAGEKHVRRLASATRKSAKLVLRIGFVLFLIVLVAVLCVGFGYNITLFATPSSTTRLRSLKLSSANGFAKRGSKIQTFLNDSQTQKFLKTYIQNLWNHPPNYTHSDSIDACLKKKLKKNTIQSNGYVQLVSVGPLEQHFYPIGEAVALAFALKASLILPLIKVSNQDSTSFFSEVFDFRHFIQSLEGIIKVVGRPASEEWRLKNMTISLPYNFTTDFVQQTIQPRFSKTPFLIIHSFRPSSKSSSTHSVSDSLLHAVRFYATFHSIRFSYTVQRLCERMMERISESSSNTLQFVAVHLKKDAQDALCKPTTGKIQKWVGANLTSLLRNQKQFDKKCPLSPSQSAQFLGALGFSNQIRVYTTLSSIGGQIVDLCTAFPQCFTNDFVVPFMEEDQALDKKNVLNDAVNVHVCMRATIFISGRTGSFTRYVNTHRLLHNLSTVMHSTSLSSILSLPSSPSSSLPSPSVSISKTDQDALIRHLFVQLLESHHHHAEYQDFHQFCS